MMIDEALKQLINFLKEASPVVWESVYRQVYVEAISYSIWFVFLLIATYGCYRVFRFGQNEEDRDSWSDWDFGKWVFAVIGVFVIVGAIICLNAAIGRFVNPEFYAIRYLISQVQ